MTLPAGNPFRTWAAFNKWKEHSRQDPQAAAEMLVGSFEEAWETGNTARRERVLTYIIIAKPASGIELVWKGVRSRSHFLVGIAFIALRIYVKDAGVVLTGDEQDLVKKILRSTPNATAVNSGLEMLETLRIPALETLIEDIGTSGGSPATRFEANYRLLWEGRIDVASRLNDRLEDIQPRFEKEFAIERLLRPKVRALLAPEGLAKAEALAAIEMDKLRERANGLENPWSGAACYLVRRWVQECGMPYQPGDIDLVAAVALSPDEELKDRLEAVTMLGWFDEREATAWLEKLSGSEYPQQLRRAARKFVRTREVRFGS